MGSRAASIFMGQPGRWAGQSLRRMKEGWQGCCRKPNGMELTTQCMWFPSPETGSEIAAGGKQHP